MSDKRTTIQDKDEHIVSFRPTRSPPQRSDESHPANQAQPSASIQSEDVYDVTDIENNEQSDFKPIVKTTKGLRKGLEEQEIACTQVTMKNVFHISNMQLRRRRVREYDALKESLSIASNCLESRKMIQLLEQVARKPPTDETDRMEREKLKLNLEDYKAVLHRSVDAYNPEEIISLQGSLESLVLRYDPGYIESVQSKKFKLQAAVVENIPPRPPPTWQEDFPYRLLSFLQGDYTGEKQRVTKEEQRWWVSRSAWLLAISLMIVAIIFISLDFYRSLTNPALSTKIMQLDGITLPVVWACITFPYMPAFLGYNETTKHVGYPIWAVRSYTDMESETVYLFPETHETVAESLSIGPEPSCNKTMQYMSLRNIQMARSTIIDVTRCYSCFRVGFKKPIWVNHSKAINRPPGVLTLEFSLQKEIDFCFTRGGIRNTYVQKGMKQELKKHSKRLADVGAMMVLDPPGDVNFALEHGFRAIEELGDLELTTLTITSIYCNLYLFSDVFYPVEPGTQIRYSYNHSAGINAWQRLEDESKYLKIHPNYRLAGGEGSKVDENVFMNEMYNVSEIDYSISTETSVKLYSMESKENCSAQPSVMDFSAVLRETYQHLVLYTKSIEQGVTMFSNKVHLGSQKRFLVMYPYRRLNVSLDFASFNVEVNMRVPTTTLAEFLTDLFEYVGLFTGVCTYSLLVSPARIYLRRIQAYGRDHAQNR